MNMFDQFDPTSAATPVPTSVDNPFDQFDEVKKPQLFGPKTEGPKDGLWPKVKEVAKGELRGFETPDIPKPSFVDLIKGIPQGVAGIGTGVGSFVASLPMTLPTVLEGTLAGKPLEGLKAAHEEAEKIREAWTYQPTTRFGKIATYDVAYPFMKAYEGLDKSVRALGGDDKAVGVASYIADWALVGGPKLLKRKGKRKKEGPPEIPKKLLEEKVAEITPDLPIESVDLILDAIKAHETKATVEAAIKPEGPATVFEGNQAVVDGLRTVAEGKEGFSKKAYERAANIVSEMGGDIGVVDLKGVKGIGPKTQAVIEGLLKERRPVEADVPLEFGPEPKPIPEVVLKEPVPTSVPLADVRLLEDAAQKILEAKEVPMDASLKKSIKQPIEPKKSAFESIVEDPSKGLEDAVNWIAKESKDKSFRTIADRITHKLEGVSLRVVEPSEIGALKNFPADAAGITIYDTPTGPPRTLLKSKAFGEGYGISETTILHEALHAVTSRLIYEGSRGTSKNVKLNAAVNDLHVLHSDVLNAVQKWMDEGKLKGNVALLELQLESAYELVTYGLTDARFQGILKEIKLPSGKTGWNAFVDKLRKLLGLSKFDTNALGRLIDITDRIVEPKVELPKIELPRFETLVEAEGKFEIGSEIPLDQALREFGDPQRGEFGAAQIGDKYYRTAEKVSMEEIRPSVEVIEKLVEEVEPTARELRNVELERYAEDLAPPPAGTIRLDGKNVPTAEAVLAFGKWRERLIEKSTRTRPKTRETSPLIGDEFKTFESREAAIEYLEIKGQRGEPLQDGLSGKWILEPELKSLEDFSWERGREPLETIRKEEAWYEEVSLGEPGEGMVRDLVDLFNNERGAMDTTPMRVVADKIIDILETTKRAKLELPEYLNKIGVPPEIQSEFFKVASKLPEFIEELRRRDPIVEGIIHPDVDSVIHQRVKKNSKGKVVGKYVPITEKQRNVVFDAPKDKWKPGFVGKFMESTEIRLNAMEYRYGKKVKEMFWDPWTKKAMEAKRERVAEVKVANKLKKSLSKEELKAVNVNAYIDQYGGKEALKASGVDKIPALSVKGREVLEYFRKKYDELLDRINYTRSRIGLEPIPKMQNYFPFIHGQNALKAHGITSNLLASPLMQIQGTMARFKGTFFPFEKKRKITDISLKLDIFDAYETYLNSALKELHVAPIAALAKELSLERLPVKGRKRGKKLVDHNYGLAKVLSEWADEIMGLDPIQAMLRERQPVMAAGLDKLQLNLVSAMLMLNVSTILKQPTAILGVYTRTTLRDTVNGVLHAIVEKPFSWKGTRAERTSNILSLRTFDILATELAEAISSGVLAKSKVRGRQLGSKLIGLLDSITANAGWYAGEAYAKRVLKLKGDKVTQWADDLVARTQGMGVKGAVSSIQAYGAYKWIMLLQTFAIADFNFLARDVMGIKNPDITKPQQVKRVVKYVIGAAIINELFSAAGMDAPKSEPVEAYYSAKEEDKSTMQALTMSLLELAEVIPVVSNIKFASSLLGPIGEFASDVPEGLLAIVDMLDWEGMTKRQRFNNALMVGQLFGTWRGVPGTSQLVKSVRSWANGGTGYEVLMGIYIEDKRKRKLRVPIGRTGGPSAGPPGPPRPPS